MNNHDKKNNGYFFKIWLASVKNMLKIYSLEIAK